jgi:hypothetical protein
MVQKAKPKANHKPKQGDDPKPGDNADKKIAGGDLIPLLLSLVTNVLAKLNYKYAFWALFGLALLPLELGFYGVLRGLGRSFLVLLGGFFATVASYKKRPSPFPSCTKLGLDVLMGKSVQVSEETGNLHANNNVSMVSFKGEYVLAYRKSDVHFPSAHTRMLVTTSKDLVQWEQTFEHATGNDLREMLLFQMGDKLFLYFFSLLPEGTVFKPIHMYCTVSDDARTWSEPKQVCKKSEVPWDIKVYLDDSGRQVAYKASYLGDHYGTDDVCVLFERSYDGWTWEPVGEDGAVVYRGGVCEVAFEFTSKGDLVAIGRNEDGDATGFGSQMFFAPKGNLGKWTSLSVSLPWRFDSPRMIRTDGGDGEVLLFSRYTPDKYQLAPSWLSFTQQKVLNLILCSVLPKSAAVYRIAPPSEWSHQASNSGGLSACPVQLIRLFEQAFADTGFFSVARALSERPDEWVVANYSSSCHSHAPWIYGQLTQSNIFVCKCNVTH